MDQLAQEWRDELLSTHQWTAAPNQAGKLQLPRGEAGGYMVTCDDLVIQTERGYEMNLRYRYAVVSFCPDLTKADQDSVPLAVLLVGQGDPAGVAVIVARQTPPPDVDPISQAVIKDLVEVIKDHVDEFHRDSPKDAVIDPGDVVHSFEQSLRNSIHVSSISDEHTTDVAEDAEDMVLTAMRTAMKAFKDAVGKQKERSESSAKSGMPYMLWPDDQFFPNTRTWPLPWLDTHHGPSSSPMN